MYCIETYELGLPDWAVYREKNEPHLPAKQFSDVEEAVEFARSLTVVNVCLARIVDDQGSPKHYFDYGQEYRP